MCPREPGWVAWARVWKERGNRIRVYFSEAVGDVYQEPVKESYPSAKTGVHELCSPDGGITWEDRGWRAGLSTALPPAVELRGRRINPIAVLQLADGRLLASFLAVHPNESFRHRDFASYDQRWLSWELPEPVGLVDLRLEEMDLPRAVTHLMGSRDGNHWDELFALAGRPYRGVGRLVSLLQLRDGTLVCAGGRSSLGTSHSAPHDSTILIQSTDGGRSWSEPITVYPTDGSPGSDRNVSAECSMVELSTAGQVLLLQRRNQPGGKMMLRLSRRGRAEWESSEMKCPFRGMRQPNLLLCRDGSIWNWDSDGNHYASFDEGQTWRAHRIAPTYYGRMVQADDGAIVSITQANIADRPFPHTHDATLRMTRFSYRMVTGLSQEDAGASFAVACLSHGSRRDFHAGLWLRAGSFCGLAFRILDAKSFGLFAVRILDELPFGVVASGPCLRKRAALLFGEVRNGSFSFIMQREVYGGLEPDSWVQIQVKAHADRLMGALRESRDRASVYLQARDRQPSSGGLGFVTHQSTGAFKDLELYEGSRQIRDTWKPEVKPAPLPQSGPRGGLEGRRKSAFWF